MALVLAIQIDPQRALTYASQQPKTSRTVFTKEARCPLPLGVPSPILDMRNGIISR